MTSNGLKDTIQSAVQLNKDHQYALNVYAERLEAELGAVDKLLNAAELEEEESNPDIAGCIQIPGACKPVGFLSSTDLLSQDSPFYDDATRRQQFLSLTEYHPTKPKELESLAEAVRLENRRLRAYEAQRRGEPSFAAQYSMRDLESTEGLDWERIASKVNTDSSAISQRSARECEIRWLGDRHPKFNHSPWTASEITAAKALVEGCERSDIDWVSITEQLGTRRTPIDVMSHAIARKTHVWDTESDKRLVEAVRKYGTESWSLVARAVSEDAQINSCQNRWYRTLDPSIRRGNWSPDEDARLRLAVDLYGHAWMEVASVIPGRNNEQCRDRWTERLNPKVPRGKWTAEEDSRLLSAVDEFGVGRWKEVSERVGTGRTDNMCRYRYEARSRGSSVMTFETSEAQTGTGGPASSKPRQRNRKGKEREPPSGSTGTTSAQNDVSLQDSQTRTRNRKKTQARRGDSEVIERDAEQPGAGTELPPASGTKKPHRPKARPLAKAKTQTQATSLSPDPQITGEIQPAASEATAVGTMESVNTSPPTREEGEENSREETHRVSRKRANPASHESRHTDKRRKTSGADSSSTGNTNTDSALRNQSNEGVALSVAQSDTSGPGATTKKSQAIRRTTRAPTRVQPKRSSQS